MSHWYIQAEPDHADACIWRQPSDQQNVSEAPHEINLAPEDMTLPPEEMQADEEKWTVEDEQAIFAVETAWVVEQDPEED